MSKILILVLFILGLWFFVIRKGAGSLSIGK